MYLFRLLRRWSIQQPQEAQRTDWDVSSGRSLATVDDKHPFFGDHQVIGLLPTLVLQSSQALLITVFELLCTLFVVLLSQARDQVRVQSLQCVLELLELWENEELVLALASISAIQVSAKGIEVVILPESVVLPSPTDVSAFKPMGAVHVVVFRGDLRSLQCIHDSVMDGDLVVGQALNWDHVHVLVILRGTRDWA